MTQAAPSETHGDGAAAAIRGTMGAARSGVDIPVGDYDSTRQRHVAHMTARLPEYLERLTWSVDRLRVERTLRLRELLRTVAEARAGRLTISPRALIR